MKAKRWGFMALAVALAMTMLFGCQALIKPEEPEARSYNTACYMEQGGARWVCGDGGTLLIGEGGTLDASDATVTLGALTGDVTGDVTGTLTGDVVGNVTGDVTGTLTGDVVGNVTGDVTGTLTGDITGPTTLTGLLTVTDEIVYGANSLYPLGVGLSGFQIGFGSTTVTGTITATHTTGTPYVVLCTLETWSVDTAYCVALGTTGVITATVYDITGSVAVTTPVEINWLVIGLP